MGEEWECGRCESGGGVGMRCESGGRCSRLLHMKYDSMFIQE